jgi:hypothetical protein
MLLLMSRALVGTATRYTLDGRRIGCQWKARFYAPIQSDSESHPASCGQSRQGMGLITLSHLAPRLKDK